MDLDSRILTCPKARLTGKFIFVNPIYVSGGSSSGTCQEIVLFSRHLLCHLIDIGI